MARNKVAPDSKFHQSKDGWNRKFSDRSNPNSDPFFAKQRPRKQEIVNESSGPFFVSKKDKSEIIERKHFDNRNNKFIKPSNSNTQGFFNNKSTGFDNKFRGGKVGKKTDKKPFDKKKWRLQKYSKKYKLEQWEDKRKKAVLRGYYNEIKDEQPTVNVQKIYEQYDSDNETENKTEKTEFPLTEDKNQSTSKKIFKGNSKSIAYKKAQSEFQRIKEERQDKREEIVKRKAEREEALLEYKKKKTEKYKKLNKKTKRGQPIMKDRIEMLLEKIQSS